MLNDWTDRMTPREADEHRRRRFEEKVAARVAEIEGELRRTIERERALPGGFYEAMSHFLTLRDKLFPNLPGDPAWRILVTLAQTPDGSDKNSVTGIAHGAEVPLSTALRYLSALELEGIVERVPDPDDKRRVTIHLTAEGRRRLDAIAEKWATRLLVLVVIPLVVFLVIRR